MSDPNPLHPELTPPALVDSASSNWHFLAERVLAGDSISADEGLHILLSSDDELLDLLAAAYRIRKRWFGRRVRSLRPLGLCVANSIFVGDYLTTKGQPCEDDYRMIDDLGFDSGVHVAGARGGTRA